MYYYFYNAGSNVKLPAGTVVKDSQGRKYVVQADRSLRRSK